MTDPHLTAEDYASVEQAEQLLRQRGWSRGFTLNQMTQAWAQLISQIEHGYQDVVEEYTNDLSCRDWLAQVWPLLTQRVRAARAPELTALDERFKAATVDDGGLALSHFYQIEGKNGWWWRRRPRLLLGEFAADLRRVGIA